MTLYPMDSFEDTVYPRCKALFARFEHIKMLLETLDFTAAPPAQQNEVHAFLTALEQWMDALEMWDRDMMERERSEAHKMLPEIFGALFNRRTAEEE